MTRPDAFSTSRAQRLRQGRLRAFVQRPGKNGGARLASVHPSLGADSPAARVSLRNSDIPVRIPCGEGKDPRRQLPRHVRPEQLHQLLQSLHVQVREREREGLCVKPERAPYLGNVRVCYRRGSSVRKQRFDPSLMF